MTLKELILSLGKEERDAFAARCGTTTGHLKQVMYGNRACSAELAIEIDRESQGAIKCDDLCPGADFEYLRSKAS